ncbi:hypothetical protein UC8_20280 [Roseimaritima ulvae]|uniref:Uncharacterized protein n=1 Tax=Roseimaritima ulvae TaxID=980254 RepID=A0A5B9QM92_9BACT|nr:hypothetical protein UC8_20280 [Roseimaritima ulvae]
MVSSCEDEISSLLTPHSSLLTPHSQLATRNSQLAVRTNRRVPVVPVARVSRGFGESFWIRQAIRLCEWMRVVDEPL